jgi:hypothetical protein
MLLEDLAFYGHMRIISIAKRTQLEYLLVFLFSLILGTFWQFHKAYGDPDGFFHVQMALFLSQGKILTQLPWMQFTTLTQHFTDQHFLYHLALVPFVKLGDPLLGGKMATIVFMSLFFLTFHRLVRKTAGSIAPLLTFLLMFSASFTFRLGLVKANSLSLIVLLCIIMAALKHRWIVVAILQGLYVWLYGGWILGVAVIGVYWVLSAITVGWRRAFSWSNNPAWKLLIASLIGTVIGLVFNPYWPYNLYFYWQQIVQIGIINYAGRINVGSEWLPLNLKDAVLFHIFPVTLALLVAIFSWKRHRHLTVQSWWLVTLAIVFFIFTVKSRRYVEFSTPFIFIALGSVWHEAWPNFHWRELWRRYTSLTDNSIILPLYMWTFTILMTPLFFGVLLRDTYTVHAWIANSGFPMNGLAAESRWLAENSQEGDIVFHSDWDLWPMLFYYNQKNYYLVGLDPTFMYNYNPALYDTWTSITTAQTTEQIDIIIATSFKSKYVLVTNDAREFIKALDNNNNFVLAYQGPSARIYKVNLYNRVDELSL